MKRVVGSLAFTLLLSGLVFGQASFNTTIQTTDFSGEWTEIPHEIGFTAELYDYSGLPVNAAGRMRFDTGDISDWSIPEFVCRPHPGVYNWFYGGGNRITKEIDPITREITAYHIQFFRAPDRPVYMDGRPHPPEWAPHTWAGFSTGTYDGNTLVITTTHLKESYIRANTAVFSEKSTVAEGFPHFLPGKNPYVADAAKKFGLPLEAIKGGKATIYPEYRQRLKELMK